MIPRKSGWERKLTAPGIQNDGVRILCRVSFICIAVTAWSMNEADQMARAKGLLSFRVEVPTLGFGAKGAAGDLKPQMLTWGLGTHACMQPEPQEIEPEPAPKEPPCPRAGRAKGANSNNSPGD